MFNPKNIISILGYGLYGFAYLLLYLTYDLLKKEQKAKSPRELILKKISSFMQLILAMVIIVGGFELVQMRLDYKNEINIPQEVIDNFKLNVHRLETHNNLNDITVEELKAAVNSYLEISKPIIQHLEESHKTNKK